MTWLWPWSKAPHAPQSDADTAVRLARQAVDWYPDEAAFWTTLGIACYRQGDLSAAAKAIEKSMELDQGKSPINRLVMDAIDHRRGDPQLANQTFEKALSLLAKARSHMEDKQAAALRLHQATATALVK